MSSSPRFPIAAALAALAATSSVVPAATMRAGDAPASERERTAYSPEAATVIETLRILRDPDAPAQDELLRALLPAARSTVPLLFDVLASRRVPTHDGEPAQALSIYQEELTLAALGKLPASRVLAQVDTALEVSESARVRRAAIRVLGVAGSSSAGRRMLLLARPAPEGDASPDLEIDRATREALREGLADLLEREPSAMGTLKSLRRDAGHDGTIAILRAVGDSRDDRGYDVVLDVLRWTPALAQEALAQIARLRVPEDAGSTAALRRHVSGLLDASDVAVARSAALALAHMNDLESLPGLIELLADDNEGLRRTVHGALVKMTGVRLSARSDSWERWHRREQAWMGADALACERALESSDPGRVAAALREGLAHPLFRATLVESMRQQLVNMNDDIRSLACGALADAGANAAVEDLAARERDPSAKVRASAREALGRLGVVVDERG